MQLTGSWFINSIWIEYFLLMLFVNQFISYDMTNMLKNCPSNWVSVQKPREQVADAEALLDIANTLVTSVKSQTNAGVTPSDLVTCFLSKYGQHGGGFTTENPRIHWKKIGIVVSPIFRKGQGCCTM